MSFFYTKIIICTHDDKLQHIECFTLCGAVMHGRWGVQTVLSTEEKWALERMRAPIDVEAHGSIEDKGMNLFS